MQIHKGFKSYVFSISRKIIVRIFLMLALFFLLLNILAFFHAYKFTHFTDNKVKKTKNPDKLSLVEKLKTIIFGIDNPRPFNETFPDRPYQTLLLESNKKIECWYIKTDNSKGTVVLFHGFNGHKSLMLDRADIFLKLGYSTLLVDFMGSGVSSGNQTTIGFFEAVQVKDCFDYLIKQQENKIYLFGISMGAVAIMKALNDYNIKPAGIIIECPFGSMYQTVCARFREMNIPVFPMAGLLVFWGGIQNRFWAFGHNPAEYAKKIDCPVLLLYGEKDKKVSRSEIDEIFINLKGWKKLKTYQFSGHENYLLKYKNEWIEDVNTFMVGEKK